MAGEIECKFSNTNWTIGVSTTSNLYRCEVTTASITKPDTRVASFKGEHLPGKSNNDVEAISFTNKVVNYFPLGLDKIFPNLKCLAIAGCDLREISRRDLIGLENLTSLWLRGNELQSLPDNLFKRMTNLTIVMLNSNKLKFLSSKLLRPILNNKLEIVDFGSSSANIVQYRAGPLTLGSVQELCGYIDSNFEKPIIRQDKIVQAFPERTFRGFKELWTSGLFSDFVIVCDSKELKVHRSVLLTQSPVLAAAPKSDMEESKTGRMEIKDFSKEAVEDFLKYLYTGETPKATNAMEILALASKYAVLELKALMEEIVLDNIDETNALEILVLAKQHNCQMLVQDALTEIQLMFADKELDLNLIDDPEELKRLIDAKHHYESLCKRFSKHNLK